MSYTPGGVTGGWQPWVGMGSAKAAVESMCRYFAVALARQGVTVNAVSPGPSDETTLIGQAPQEVQSMLTDWINPGWTPMRRCAAPADIANVCSLLCSEEASFVTGQVIAVDGGSSLMNPDFPLPLQVPK
jgi:enoyl-[acyl-carrier protein] reductase III